MFYCLRINFIGIKKYYRIYDNKKVTVKSKVSEYQLFFVFKNSSYFMVL